MSETEQPITDDQSAEATGVPAPTPNTSPEGIEPDPVPAGAETAEANDDEDVKALLERETADGSGFTNESELPKEDFDGYAEDDVEEPA